MGAKLQHLSLADNHLGDSYAQGNKSEYGLNAGISRLAFWLANISSIDLSNNNYRYFNVDVLGFLKARTI